MADTTKFNLDSALHNWSRTDCHSKNNKPSNIENQLTHFRQSVEELTKVKGLTEEEAFAVLKARFNGSNSLNSNIREVNDENYHFQKITFLFTGILICFITFYLIVLSSELYFLILTHFSGASTAFNIEKVSEFIKATYIIIIGAICILFLLDDIVVNLLYKIPFKLSIAFILVALLVTLIFTEKILLEKALNIIGGNGVHRGSLYILLEKIRHYYTSILAIGFLILYFRYTKKTFAPTIK